MLYKLQRKTLIPSQIVGYALTLLVGMSVVMLAVQAFVDLKPLLTQQTDVFKAHTVTVSKNVTLFKTANKEGIYFNDKELDKIREQEFVKDVALFNSATFNTSAAISFGGQRMGTDMFFESVPDSYIDVQSDDWHWDSTSDFLPIIIPEDYLNLYNFGFAESQSLPVISEAMLSQVSFNIYVEGNGKRRVYNSRIVGLSSKINSILVPDAFLRWANKEYGSANEKHCSRILVEFTDATHEEIPSFFELNGLNINKSELESSKLAFFFKLAMFFVMAIALVIIALSVSFIVLSFNLIVHKNRNLFVNLYNIGYAERQIARFYRMVISGLTVVVLLLAALVALWVRGLYASRLSMVFSSVPSATTIWVTAVVAIIALLVLYSFLIGNTIRKTLNN